MLFLLGVQWKFFPHYRNKRCDEERCTLHHSYLVVFSVFFVLFCFVNILQRIWPFLLHVDMHIYQCVPVCAFQANVNTISQVEKSNCFFFLFVNIASALYMFTYVRIKYSQLMFVEILIGIGGDKHFLNEIGVSK